MGEVIRKDPAGAKTPPNLRDYAAEYAHFSWADARSALDGLPGGGGLNIAHEAVDRHANGARARGISRCAGSAEAARFAISPIPTCRSGPAASPMYCRGSELRRESACSCSQRASLNCILRFSAALKHRCVVSPLFSAFGPEPIATRMAIGEGRVLVTTTGLYRKKLAALRERLPTLKHVLVVREEPGDSIPDGHARSGGAARLGGRRLSHRPYRSRGPRAAAFHQRHDRQAEGRDPRARGRGCASRHRAARARPASGGCILVHGRSGLGDRDLLRHHRAARHWRHADRRRGRLRCRALVRHARAGAGQRLVHGADGGAHDDEGGHRDCAPAAVSAVALHRERGRAAEPAGRVLGHGGIRSAHPRQLVADRDRRDHGREFRLDGHPPRLDGPGAARV